jgi:hypothetical protein
VRFDAAHALVCVAPLIGDGVGLAAISSPTNRGSRGSDREPARGSSIQAGLGRNVDLILVPGDHYRVFNERGVSIMAKRIEPAMRSDFDDAVPFPGLQWPKRQV